MKNLDISENLNSIKRITSELTGDNTNTFFSNIFSDIFLLSQMHTFIDELVNSIDKLKYPKIYEMLLGYKYLFQNEQEKSVDQFLRVTDILNDNCFYAYIELGNIYHEQKIFENARYYYNKSIENLEKFEPQESLILYDLPWVHFKIGLLNIKLEDFHEAEKSYSKILEVSPKTKGVKNNLAYVLLKQNKLDEAIKIFDDCIKNKIDGETPYWNKIRCLKKLKKFDEAIIVAEQLKRKSKKKITIENEIKSLEKMIKNKNNKEDNQLEDNFQNEENESQFIMEDKPYKSKLAEESSIGTERLLEDLFIRKIINKEKVFDRNLVIDFLERPSRQYVIRGKRIDILALDIDTNELVIIELKKVKSSEEVFEQITNYMDWVKTDVAKNQEVAGIICVPEMTEKLITKTKSKAKLEIHTFSLLTNKIA